jgi:Tfp pilus assembly protein PilF
MSRLEAVKAMVAQDPENARVRYMLCMEHLSAGDWGSAAAEFGQLISRDPNYVAAYFQQGRAYEQLGDEDKARASYRNGIEAAKRAGDAHALSELQAALDILGG